MNAVEDLPADTTTSSAAEPHQNMSDLTEVGSNLPAQDYSYNDSAVVWVRLGQSWWPGSVIALERCPQDYIIDFKKAPIAVVKFFNESGMVDIHKHEHIYPYNCSRKREFIKKGISFHEKCLRRYSISTKNNLRSVQKKEELFKKFECDVLMAEKLTGGQEDIFAQIEEESSKRRIDYSNLGFGPSKPKKKKEDGIKRAGSDISQAVHYKKEQQGSGPQRYMRLEHKTVIMEQPHIDNMKEDMKKACNSYTCYICGFSCTRIGVIIWHNKSHLKTVMNYDSGIKVPGRKKRKARPFKNKTKAAKQTKTEEAVVADHSKTNGHVTAGSSQASQLLEDWDDEDDTAAASQEDNNGGASGSDEEEEEVDDGGHYHRYGRQGNSRVPMRREEDLNSAFDALLADTPSNNVASSSVMDYTNNQSDSDASDWEKYYDKDSDQEEEEEVEQGESDIKSLCEDNEEQQVSSTVTSNGGCNGTVEEEEEGDDTLEEDEEENSCSPQPSNQQEDEEEEEDEEDEGQSTPEDTGRSSSMSSSPSNSTGPAYMLVAVDAHGNNVPMPALTDRNHSSNLVAVEASMEDGTSRTLYIDPAYLEPNVDLSNLMLHIDNSGQETVIIPSSSSPDTTPQEASAVTSMPGQQSTGEVTSSSSVSCPAPVEHQQDDSDEASTSIQMSSSTEEIQQEPSSDTIQSNTRRGRAYVDDRFEEHSLYTSHQSKDTQRKLTNECTKENNVLDTLCPDATHKNISIAQMSTDEQTKCVSTEGSDLCINTIKEDQSCISKQTSYLTKDDIKKSSHDMHGFRGFHASDTEDNSFNTSIDQLLNTSMNTSFASVDSSSNRLDISATTELKRSDYSDANTSNLDNKTLYPNSKTLFDCTTNEIDSTLENRLDEPSLDQESIFYNEENFNCSSHAPKSTESLKCNETFNRSGSHINEQTRSIQFSASVETTAAHSSGDNCSHKAESKLVQGPQTQSMAVEDEALTLEEGDDDPLPDLGSLPTGHKVSPHPVNSVVWVQLDTPECAAVSPVKRREVWWPAYVTECQCSHDTVTVTLIDKSVSLNVTLNKVETLSSDRLVEVMSYGVTGVLCAFSAAVRYAEYSRINTSDTLTPQQFFRLTRSEQESRAGRNDSLSSPGAQKLKRKTSSVCHEEIDEEMDLECIPLNSPAKKDHVSTQNFREQHTLSARENRKLQSVLKARRWEIEALVKFMKSKDCVQHLQQVLQGVATSDLHATYQTAGNRDSMKSSLHWGPLHMDQYRGTVCSLVNFFRDELVKFSPEFANPEQYAILVWLPEAIRHALRVVRKVPEEELESALRHGYRETPTEKKARKLFF